MQHVSLLAQDMALWCYSYLSSSLYFVISSCYSFSTFGSYSLIILTSLHFIVSNISLLVIESSTSGMMTSLWVFLLRERVRQKSFAIVVSMGIP